MSNPLDIQYDWGDVWAWIDGEWRQAHIVDYTFPHYVVEALMPIGKLYVVHTLHMARGDKPTHPPGVVVDK